MDFISEMLRKKCVPVNDRNMFDNIILYALTETLPIQAAPETQQAAPALKDRHLHRRHFTSSPYNN